MSQTQPATMPLAGLQVRTTPALGAAPPMVRIAQDVGVAGLGLPMLTLVASPCTAGELRALADHLDTLFEGQPE